MDTKPKLDADVRIVRSKRKSISGEVLPDGSIQVRAPLWATDETVRQFLDKYAHHFAPLIRQNREWLAQRGDATLVYGGTVPFLGGRIPIRAASEDSVAEKGKGKRVAWYENGEVLMRPGLSEEEMRDGIGTLFRGLAWPILERKMRHYAPLMGVRYAAMTIGKARKRHGSCSSTGRITFSWRILMMNEAVVDYIVVHELAHLRQMNHSKAFYAEVARILPDYKERQKGHAECARLLQWEGWMT